jgi:nucleoside-specific outer membrane channel protein Tsx
MSFICCSLIEDLYSYANKCTPTIKKDFFMSWKFGNKAIWKIFLIFDFITKLYNLNGNLEIIQISCNLFLFTFWI